MSAVQNLLSEVAAAGGRVRLLDGGRLNVQAKHPLPAELMDRLRGVKAELIAELSGANAQADDFEERAALVEYEAGVPRAWAEGFARLDTAKPPGDVPPSRWRTFIDDAGRFFEGGWAQHAAALGWGPLDLFGCDRHRPFARIDNAGLIWLLDGRRLLALTADSAAIENRKAPPHTYRRGLGEPGRAALAWELAP